jgi:hypothetical protein
VVASVNSTETSENPELLQTMQRLLMSLLKVPVGQWPPQEDADQINGN